MKTRIILLLVALSAAAPAQSTAGYVYFAPGKVSDSTGGTLHFGAGFDAIVGKGMGVGADIGALSPWTCFSECVVGTFSPNVSYHFLRDQERRADPFVTAGYTLMFRNGHVNLFNFGGGTNYWFARRIGLRAEFRDHVYLNSGSSLHFWGARFGLTFR